MLIYVYGGPGNNQRYRRKVGSINRKNSICILKSDQLTYILNFTPTGSQQVDYRWPGVGWGEFLVSNYDIVYASIDGRGTGFQSDDYTFQLYKNLGTVEMEVEQINRNTCLNVL